MEQAAAAVAADAMKSGRVEIFMWIALVAISPSRPIRFA
jgi:hypothetical protein